MALRTAVWAVSKDVPVRAQNTNWSSTPRQGAPERTTLTVGKRSGRLHRAFLDFSVDQADIGILHKAELVVYTNDTDYPNGTTPKVRIYRNTKEFAGGGTGTGWQNTESVNPSVATGAKWSGAINQAIDGETRIDITTLVGRWLNKNRRYLDGAGVEQTGKNADREGIRLQAAYRETDWQRGFSIHSNEATDGSLRPHIYIEYEPPNYAPDVISTIQPTGTVLPDQPFTGEFGDPNGDEPAYIKLEVRKASNQNIVWAPVKFPFELSWVDQGGTWLWSIDNPGSEVLKSDIGYEWRAKGFDGRGKDSGWTGWRAFTQSGTAPSVTVRPLGTRDTLVGVELEADWVVEQAIVSYRVQLKGALDLWTQPTWDQTFLPVTSEELALGHIRFQYGGPRLAAGDYDWRVLVVDSRGVSSVWASDDRFTLTVGSEEDLDDGSDALPPNTTGFARAKTKVRIVLRDTDGANRGPGTIKAIIEDAHNVGFSAITNEPGEFFFTLTALHPQAGECEPFQRHYALQMYRNGAWKDVANGLLVDFDAGEDDIIIYGLDYLGMLSRSIDTRFPPPGTNLNASHSDGGAKYKNKTISSIVQDQLIEATGDTDAPLSFFNIGTIQTLDTKVSIYSSFKQRLDFIRGLLDSHRQGSGLRTRLKARKDPSQKDRWEWDLRNQPGIDRDNLRLEYGSNLQGFRVIAMGEDYATRGHGVGTEPNSVKPKYFVYPAVGQSDFLTQTFGNLQRVEVWPDLVDLNDLKRRVKQLRKEDSKVGKRIRLAIKVHSMEPFDGYDLTDSFPLDIDRGLVETERYGSGYWTIWGLEWRLYPDGHDELTWAVKPREDDEPPDPDLIPSDPIHDSPEWVIGSGPPPAEPTITAARYYLDEDTGTVYYRVPTNDENDSYGWVEEVTLPAIPPPTGGWYPGDYLPPPPPTAFSVVALEALQDDGTVHPVLEATWVNVPSVPDVIGYELQWDASDTDDEGTIIPADWLNQQVFRADVEAQRATLDPVLGSRGYEVRIRSYDMEGLSSDWVTHARVVAAPDGEAPEVPTGVSVIGGYTLISVNWGGASESDFAFYQMRVRVLGAPEGWPVPFIVKSNRVTVTDLGVGIEYEVQVRAIDRSGNVRLSEVDETVVNYLVDEEAGWSAIANGTTTLVGSEDVAVHTLAAEFVWTGVLDADRVVTGDLTVGGRPDSANVIRMYGAIEDGAPAIAAQGDFGLIMVDPLDTSKAMWLHAGLLQFTNAFDYQGDPLEAGISGTVWTTAVGPDGINAEAITFGSQFGGNNRVLNAGFELQDFDTAALVEDVKTDAATFGVGRYVAADINLDVSGTELKMVTV